MTPPSPDPVAVPLGRVALPADIVAGLLYLSSDLAGYVNGQTLIRSPDSVRQEAGARA